MWMQQQPPVIVYCWSQTDDFVDFFERCQSGLAPGGLICVKENITKSGVDLDSEDSSVTRYENNVSWWGGTPIQKGAGVLVGKFEKNSSEIPRSCFVGMP